ncbi:MAG: PQQ-dependent sugar dehydrogenase [Rhodospirillales bacterium]|nr:PQQ-dependent sugar dehydrogenase [Rhodospirillales bacterium]MDP6803828.1 PQQ-dependent sugar dehydrogenase [Rhodospirillales bacterium]
MRSRIRTPLIGATVLALVSATLGACSAVADDLNAVFVGTRGDSVYAIVDDERDGTADRTLKVLSGLNVANGIAYGDAVLYVAEQHRVARYDVRDLESLARARPTVIYNRLPDKRWHGWRYAALGPDRGLYVTVGSPCNICKPTGLEGTILRFDPGGGEPQIVARGVRNSVGMDFHPNTGELFFTDNGADGMGDDVPPDELNHAPRAGMHFGFPYYGGGDAATDFLPGGGPPLPVIMPVVAFAAHVAALGVHFYRGATFPPQYRGDAFVAQHGSWNRTIPDGYRIARVRFDESGGATWKPFAEGWLTRGQAWGRPVDVKEHWDGSLLISDDRAGVVYRIAHGS